MQIISKKHNMWHSLRPYGRPRLWSIFLASLAILFQTGMAAAQQEVRTIDGAVHSGRLTELDARQAVVSTEAGRQAVPLTQVQEIRFSDPPADPLGVAGQAIILTARGSKLAVANVRSGFAEASPDKGAGDGKVSFAALTGAAVMALDQVDTIIFPARRGTARDALEQIKRLALPDRSTDYLIARGDGGELVPVAGVLLSVDAAKVGFRYDQQDRTIDLEKVLAVRLSQPASAPAPPAGMLTGADGSVLTFRSAALADGALRLEGTELGEASLPLEKAAAIRFRNENLVYLDDLTPAGVEQAGTFDKIFRHRTGQSAAGGPIVLDGRSFSRGLGLHSRCSLTYALNGQYKWFVAAAGIDDSARPGGDATLAVTADGKSVLAPIRLTGKDKAMPIRVDVAGAKSLTILVDFGEGLDVGDHVDLAEARLIK